MAEKVSARVSSTARSCNSKRSTDGAVRVVHISNPTIIVETSASEFRAVVQSLTGLKRSSPSSSQHEEINLYSDDQYSPQVKAPKLLADESQCLNYKKPSESAIIDDSTTVTDCCNDGDRGDVLLFEELEVQPIQTPDYIPSQYQLFETLEGTGDTTYIVFDTFSPSILFSGSDYL